MPGSILHKEIVNFRIGHLEQLPSVGTLRVMAMAMARAESYALSKGGIWARITPISVKPICSKIEIVCIFIALLNLVNLSIN
jgi:hypothetical protein